LGVDSETGVVSGLGLLMVVYGRFDGKEVM
jgi:hypothetical protein